MQNGFVFFKSGVLMCQNCNSKLIVTVHFMSAVCLCKL